jgi:hypothetical protein
MICKNCGVELEDDMMACPLCREPVNGNDPVNTQVPYGTQTFQGYGEMSKPQKKFTWEIISIIYFRPRLQPLSSTLLSIAV